MTLRNTLIANSPQAYNCAQFAGSVDVQSPDYNLFDDNAFNSYCPSFQSPDLSIANANLGPLSNNGGPTQTHLPLPGSAALDAIPNGVHGCGSMVDPDQHGVSRPQGTRCDIGAVEYTPGDVTPWLWLPLIVR